MLNVQTVENCLWGRRSLISERRVARIEIGFQNDDFTWNKVTVLAEERLALAVYRDESFIHLWRFWPQGRLTLLFALAAGVMFHRR